MLKGINHLAEEVFGLPAHITHAQTVSGLTSAFENPQLAAAIEQRNDEAGMIWTDAMAPWRVAVCVINPKNDPVVAEAAESLYQELSQAGVDTVLDDRGLRPGSMFADIELIGIPHRVVVSGRGLEAGTFEYRARTDAESRNVSRQELLALLGAL